MNYFYAQLNDQNVVVCLAQLSGAVDDAGMIRIESYDSSLLGCRYVDEMFTTPPPTVPGFKSWPAFDFYRKFTSPERIAIRERAKTDPIAEDIHATLNAAIASGANVRDDDPDTINGLAYLESVAVLAEGRAAEILA